MNITIHYRTYNCFGGHPILSPLSFYLIPEDVNYGTGLLGVEINVFLKSDGPPKKTLESLFDNHNELIARLPKVSHSKTRKTVTIDVFSDAFEGNVFQKDRAVSPEKVMSCANMILSALEAASVKLSKIKDYNHLQLVSDCRSKISQIPSSLDGAQKLLDHCNALGAAKTASLSPWEKLDVDWSAYPTDIRKLLDDTIYWDCTHDFSPHGNDTGADLLAFYQEWLKNNSTGDPLTFFSTLLTQWGIPVDTKDPVLMPVLDDAVVALAFAEVKHKKQCNRTIYTNAKAAIANQRKIAIESTGWNHRDLRMNYLSILESKLDQIPKY